MKSSSEVILHQIHDLFVAGSLKNGGSWGGAECRAYVDIFTHFRETCFWILLSSLFFQFFSLRRKYTDLWNVTKINLSSIKYSNTTRYLDYILATIHFSMYFQLIYYKWNFSSLINLIQPCHVILLMEGIALASNDHIGVLISVLILPSLSGTFLALFFPDTTGLDQPFEETSYWIQHYLIIFVPIYLLLRRNSLALKMSNKFTVGYGLWILTVLHFSFYEVNNDDDHDDSTFI